MRAAYSAQHWFGGAYCGTLANAVGPRSGAIENPAGIDALIFSGNPVAQQHAASPSLRHVHGEHFTVIAQNRSRLGGFRHPLGYQAFGKFALRVFVIKN